MDMPWLNGLEGVTRERFFLITLLSYCSAEAPCCTEHQTVKGHWLLQGPQAHYGKDCVDCVTYSRLLMFL
jgi:hypothetical protein